MQKAVITAGRLQKMAVAVVLVQNQPERAAAMLDKAQAIRAVALSFLISISFANNTLAYDNAEIIAAKRKMIAESISSYRGNCPCPYNTAANGSNCGKRSAYSKPGGAEPLCYENDITDAQAAEWLRRNKR